MREISDARKLQVRKARLQNKKKKKKCQRIEDTHDSRSCAICDPCGRHGDSCGNISRNLGPTARAPVSRWLQPPRQATWATRIRVGFFNRLALLREVCSRVTRSNLIRDQPHSIPGGAHEKCSPPVLLCVSATRYAHRAIRRRRPEDSSNKMADVMVCIARQNAIHISSHDSIDGIGGDPRG